MEITDAQRGRAKAGILLVALILAMPNTMTLIMNDLAAAFPDATATQIQSIFSIYTLAISVSTLLAGILSRKFNEQRLAVISIVIMGLAGLIVVLAHDSLMFVYLSAAVVGFGSGMLGPLYVSIIMMLFDESERTSVMGLYGACTNIGGLIITLVAGRICASFSWVHVYYLYALFAVGALVFALLVPKVPKPEIEAANDADSGKMKVAMITKRSWLYHGLRFLITLIFTVFTVNYAMYVTGSGLGGTEQASWVYSVFSVSIAIAGLLMGKVANFLRNRAHVVMMVLTLLSYLCIALTNSMPLVFVGAALNGLATGILAGTIGEYVPVLCDTPLQFTSTVSICTLTSALGAMIAPAVTNTLTGIWTTDMLNGPFWTGVVMAALGVVLSAAFEKYVVGLKARQQAQTAAQAREG